MKHLCKDKPFGLVNMNSLEVRLSLHCVDAAPEDLKYGLCWKDMYDKVGKESFYQDRSVNVPGNPYLSRRMGYVWVSSISWSGPNAVYQTYKDSQLDTTYGWWHAFDFQTWNCQGVGDGINRRTALCSYREETWGKLLPDSDLTIVDGDPHRVIPIQTTDQYWLKSPQGRELNLQPQTMDKCILCQTVPHEDFFCPNGKVVGAPVRSEPAYQNKVMELPTCEQPCAPGTFLTCTSKDSESCAYKPPTAYELSSDAGLREWWAYNVYRNPSGANLVPVLKAAPPSYSCYPCLLADRRTHFGLVALTDTALLQKGFLSFYCPGGASGPEVCPVNQVSRVDPATNRSTACGCMPGYYWNAGLGRCALCPAGHFCAWDGTALPVARECPNDHYSEGGAEACRKCNMAKQCDSGQALTRCLQNGASGESGRFQREDAQCVLCAECVQLGAGRDGVPCYRVSSYQVSALAAA